jgi:Ca-activated chloride channel homolog
MIQEPATWNANQETSKTTAPIPVTILDGVIPSQLPDGNLFFIAPPRSTEWFSVTGEIEYPAMYPVAGDEPLLRHVSLSDISVLKATRLVAGSWAHAVIESDGTPLLVAGEREGRRILVMAFDLHQTDLPLQVAFPLLLSNLINFLAPGSGAEAAFLSPGQPLVRQISPDITEARVIRPDGNEIRTSDGLLGVQEKTSLRIQNNQLVYADTEMLGVYTVEEYQGNELQARHRYAVNLFNPNESRVQPQPNLAIEQASGLQSAETSPREGKQEIWRWLAFLALLVLIVEWVVYHKNGIVSMRQQWLSRKPR